MKGDTALAREGGEDEAARLAAVRRYDVLDTPPDGSFDRITALAARFFDVPISIISIVDHDRIWFKSHHGLDATEIGRDPGLCASAICQVEPWLVNDAQVDVCTIDNPLVAGELGLRFYLGVPLTTSDGYNLGTLNVIDVKPRNVTEAELATLKDLAAVVIDELELRLNVRTTLEERRRSALELNDEVVQDGLQAIPGIRAGSPETVIVVLSASREASWIAKRSRAAQLPTSRKARRSRSSSRRCST